MTGTIGTLRMKGIMDYLEDVHEYEKEGSGYGEHWPELVGLGYCDEDPEVVFNIAANAFDYFTLGFCLSSSFTVCLNEG